VRLAAREIASLATTPDEARMLGIRTYFTGVPCHRGHVAHRYSSSGKCVTCMTDNNKAYHAANAAEIAERKKRYADANPEKNKNAVKKYRANNLEKVRAASRKWMRKFLPAPTRSEPESCECCGSRPQSLCLDHDHRTGKFRGWLCRACNTSIGMLGDDLEGVLKAAQYLQRAKT
jgi:hypothetical protein